ncbi:MAG: hypothetical protein ABR561_07410, partial [Guyparkeria sp.]
MDKAVRTLATDPVRARLAPTSRRRTLAVRWLLVVWVLAALLAWFVPWPALVAWRLPLGGLAWSSGWGRAIALGPFALALVAWRQGRTGWAMLAIALAGALHTLVPVATLVDRTPVFADRIDCRLEGVIVGLIDDRVDRRRFTLAVQT